MKESVAFYEDDSWNVDVAKISKLIDSILEKAGDDAFEATVVLTHLFRGYIDAWGNEL
ncbi:hypothetical protein [Methanobacterium sp. CWC-01]|uniref:hypothetical protein n=1 Tax=Methanobacterium aridiramus TaxID=2584467 RepID=UPI0025767E50|nr:hypothetical protein [Methanobacterium sp. CWC-01]